jgi:hypothetical protein
MSAEALRQVIDDIQSLPEADQELVRQFITSVKERQQHGRAKTTPARNSALVRSGEVLVFTGEVDCAESDWVRLDREERDERLASFASR